MKVIMIIVFFSFVGFFFFFLGVKWLNYDYWNQKNEWLLMFNLQTVIDNSWLRLLIMITPSLMSKSRARFTTGTTIRPKFNYFHFFFFFYNSSGFENGFNLFIDNLGICSYTRNFKPNRRFCKLLQSTENSGHSSKSCCATHITCTIVLDLDIWERDVFIGFVCFTILIDWFQ
jgi:hypothetical protein